MSGINRGEPNVKSVGRDSLFDNTWGNKPTRIDPKLTLRWASQNVRGIIPKEQYPKLARNRKLDETTGRDSGSYGNQCIIEYILLQREICKIISPDGNIIKAFFSSSSEMVEGTYFKMGQTLTTSLDR
jgi:hypothetical protein